MKLCRQCMRGSLTCFHTSEVFIRKKAPLQRRPPVEVAPRHHSGRRTHCLTLVTWCHPSVPQPGRIAPPTHHPTRQSRRAKLSVPILPTTAGSPWIEAQAGEVRPLPDLTDIPGWVAGATHAATAPGSFGPGLRRESDAANRLRREGAAWHLWRKRLPPPPEKQVLGTGALVTRSAVARGDE